MAKKLHDIAVYISNSEDKFRDYLEESLSEEILLFLKELSRKYTVYLFSGIIRDFFLKQYGNRDVDVFIEGDQSPELFLKEMSYKKNSYGGYKIKLNEKDIDLWELNNTWAIKNDQMVMDFDLARYIPHTAFFNFSSIIFDLNKNKFHFTRHFLRFLRDKKIDLVYMSNPNPALCIVNSLYYSEKYRLKITPALHLYIAKMIPLYTARLEEVQTKHFGKILYTKEEIIAKLSK